MPLLGQHQQIQCLRFWVLLSLAEPWLTEDWEGCTEGFSCLESPFCPLWSKQEEKGNMRVMESWNGLGGISELIQGQLPPAQFCGIRLAG